MIDNKLREIVCKVCDISSPHGVCCDDSDCIALNKAVSGLKKIIEIEKDKAMSKHLELVKKLRKNVNGI